MNNIPMLDPRKSEDIIRAIQQKAHIYTPEWKYEPDVMDGGAALAELFSQMFGETIDRFNRMPYKHYLEFLNILDVSGRSMTPATGTVKFELVQGCDKSVVIKQGTQLFYDRTEELDENEPARVIFETAKDFSATPAKITNIFSVNPKSDIIEKLDLEQSSAKFFDPSLDKNIQRHFFAISSNDTLILKNPADVILSLENTTLGYLNEEYITRLADPAFAKWSYYDGNKQVLFDEVTVKDGKLHLIKDNDVALMSQKIDSSIKDDEERYWISCNMSADGKTDEILMNRIYIGSAYLYKDKKGVHIMPDLLYANDIALDTNDGGYCFGKQPMAYDCLYISSEEAFSKKGARINIEFNLKTVVRQIGSVQDTPQYNFNKRYIVEKVEAPLPDPDRIFISRVVWEYWNGAGWTHLKVEGDLNPFDGQEGTFTKHISFECPEDIEKNLLNSIEGYWIRARVVEVENQFSIYAQMLLPYIEAVSLDYDYNGVLKPVEKIFTENNCIKTVHDTPDGITAIRLFQPMVENAHAVYFSFDLPPMGYPVNFYFKTEGQSKTNRLLSFEYLTKGVKGEGVWCELKVNDRTDGLKEDGIVSIYAPKDFKKDIIFGQEAYWLRIVDKNLKFSDTVESYPVIQKIYLNVVEIIQKQTVLKEMFYTNTYEPNKAIILANHPVLDCELWVNEISDITKAEMASLIENKQDSVDIRYNTSGHISEFWVKWELSDSFINSHSNSRHYKLDNYTGKITFGNGKNGKIPSVGEDANIMVNYSFGGGRKGNLPEGSIEGLIVSLPYVDKVTNFEMTCGGSSQHDIRTLEKVAPQKLRHNGRAVTVSDYESIVLEQFPEVKDVKCVPNYDAYGHQAWGYITLVVMPYDLENRSYSLKLCKRIEQYLSNIVSCELLDGGRLSIIPAIVMKVNSIVTVTVNDYDYAAETEMKILEAINNYLNPSISGSHYNKIEEIPAIQDFYSLLKRIKHVSSIEEVILEGCYYDGNILKTVPLDTKFKLKYVIAASGEHTVKIL